MPNSCCSFNGAICSSASRCACIHCTTVAEALSCAARLRTPMLPGSSQHPPTGLHWHGVLQTFGEHQILAPAGDEAHAGSVETTKDRVHFLLGFQCPPGSSWRWFPHQLSWQNEVQRLPHCRRRSASSAGVQKTWGWWMHPEIPAALSCCWENRRVVFVLT